MTESTVTDQRPSADELDALTREFETAPAGKVVKWAVDTFGDALVLAASFEDVVLIDLATKVAPGIEVIFLDTEAHFPETLEFVEEIRGPLRPEPDRDQARARGGRPPLREPSSAASSARWPRCARRCRASRAWLTSLKRVDAPTRADAPIVSWDDAFGLVKVNPLATWTNDDIASYLADHDLPVHPLTHRGYRSIGCAPTTRPVAPRARTPGPAAGPAWTSPSAGCTWRTDAARPGQSLWDAVPRSRDRALPLHPPLPQHR